MRAWIVAACSLAAARPAAAHDCSGGYTFGGEQPFCPNRGAMYKPPGFSIEASAVASHVVISEEAGEAADLVPGPRDARGGSFRFHSGYAGFYFGGEFAVLALAAPVGPIARTSPDVSATGYVAEIRTLAGMRRTQGRLLLGVELGFGLRDRLRYVESEEESASAQGLVDVRASAGVWLSPYAAISLQMGAGLVRDERSSALVLTLTPIPWDGTR